MLGSAEGIVSRDLEGKVALVTGGGRGIGRAISLAFAERGANVVISYLRRRERAEETCALLEEHTVKALAVRANAGNAEQTDALFDLVGETFGRLDIFVSNAATGVMDSLERLDERAWSWTMDANARALFLGAKRAAGLMESGGRIVALSSGGAARVLPGYAIVGASKAAIESLCRYLAVELGPRGITVNAVSPGVVDTEALQHFPRHKEMLDDALVRTPVGRLAAPEDVARSVSFLTSADASMITGQTLVIDGGASLLA